MPKKSNKGFQIRDGGDLRGDIVCQVISIESARIHECMEYYQKENLGEIYISPHHGYKINHMEFFRDYPFISRVDINYAPNIKLSDLYYLPNLQSITIGGNTQAIDFSRFPKLEDLSIEWHSKVTFPESSKVLKNLAIWNYKPTSKDFTELPDFPNLEKLRIVRAPLISLAGLGRFKKLKYLALSYLSKLERISGLDAYSVEELELDVCRKISDHEHLTKLPKLWRLMLCACGTIPSLKFLDRMPKLRWFTFVDTNILDGDMTPCFRLETVGTLNKKHYSHTSEEIEAIIAERQKSKRGRKK
jgi:protein phosphatase 1 regulatory subunit 7